MRRSLLLGLLTVETAFALNVDSLPVWNPDYLVRGYASEPVVKDSAVVEHSNIETHGYKTMQVTVGDGGTQVDQELRLSVQGNVSKNVYVDALLSDVDRKAGDQTTATLQEVDQVYFRVEHPNFLLHLGDLTWRDELGLFGFERSTLGAMVGFRGGHTEVRGAVGTDEIKRASVTFNGVRGQREGYSISSDGTFLSIVPNSEKVWLNGVELSRDKDYVVNYAGGLLDFKGTLVPSEDDEIRVDYDAYEDDNIYTMYAAKGKFRHPNIFIDLSGFRLENSVSRMKKTAWTDDDYKLLKHDDGGSFERPDSLDDLKRPVRTDRLGARVRLQGDDRFYADLEAAFSRTDSNIVSDQVGGPEGLALRWFLTTDSTAGMRKLPISLSVYGNYVEEEYGISEYAGEDRDWNSYKLMDEWDLDSSRMAGDLRHDDFALRMRLGNTVFSKAEWGYRRNDSESWNSSRARLSLIHSGKNARSEIAFARVASVQQTERTRYQTMAKSEYSRGLVRPFGELDLRYTENRFPQDSADDDVVAYGKSRAGVALNADTWKLQESVGAKMAERRLPDSDNWEDSLRTYLWQQSAEAHWKFLQLEHLLQYEYSRNEGEDEGSWLGDLTGTFGNRDGAIHGNVAYKFGLTEEQTYISVYKAVAPGTGDVRYDSLTGTFIEGVDNGDFVYEGKGRNDSVGAVLASNASFNAGLEIRPALLLGVKRGFLKDVVVGGSFSSEGEDTTGKKLYFPPVTSSMLHDVSAGKIAWDGHVDWNHSKGFSATYNPGAEYEKIMSTIPYFSEMHYHDVSFGVQINENNFVGATGRYETDDLTALRILEWNIREASLKYRLGFLKYFHVEPGVHYRYGTGSDEMDENFDADLKEALVRLEFDVGDKIHSFVQFSAIDVDCGNDEIPYQMMSGYNDGRTYRLETSLSVKLNKFIALDGRYLLRFGDAEENIFQKLSTEARAFF